MKQKHLFRLLALCLVLTMVLGVMPVFAAGESVQFTEISKPAGSLLGQMPTVPEDSHALYADDEMVRVTIVLPEAPALSVMSRDDAPASAYRQSLAQRQDDVSAKISTAALDGEPLDVVWNLTLAENAISANVPYGKLDEIRQVEGVKEVFLETRYEPLRADVSNVIAQNTTGVGAVKQDAGYSGAGTRVAVIDTGTDSDHQSFDNGAYLYALSLEAEKAGMTPADYMDSLGLLDAEEIASVLDQLNVSKYQQNVTAEQLYANEKRPFNYNYIDHSFDITHDNDDMGEHGSHVAGIAAANSCIPADASAFDFNGDGQTDEADAQALLDHVVLGTAISMEENADVSGNGVVGSYDAHLLLAMVEDGHFYRNAAKTVQVSGVASEAQLLTMKVFGAKGGAYTSDYMAATEDAVVLGCEAVNLSLGAPYAGFLYSHEQNPADSANVDRIMKTLEDTGIVMCIAAGNSGNWADKDDAFGHMYTDEAGTSMTSEPSTFANALAVASADNVGTVLSHETRFGGKLEVTMLDCTGTERWNSLDKAKGTDYELAFVGDPSGLFAGTQADPRIYAGSEADFDGVDYTGKILMVARGNQVLFSQKHELAARAGAAGLIIYNNEPGLFGASLEGTAASIPCMTVSMEDAQRIFALCQQDESGAYTTDLFIKDGPHVLYGEDPVHPSMSDFSSWGSTGALQIKPEVTAPGGSIYSVNGLDPTGTGYELMSGTSMATPHVTGLTALAMQYIREQKLLDTARAVSGLQDLSSRQLAQSLIMSTAVPLTEQASGHEYAVRNQGAGLVNLEKLVSSEVFLRMDDQPDGKVKAELGDGTDGWTVSYSVYNLTDRELHYGLDASVLSNDTIFAAEGINLAADQMTELAADLTYSGETVSGDVLTVPASGSASVTVKIDIPQETVQERLALGYTNGFYVEGFLYLRPLEDAEGKLPVEQSIPMLGFFGNWTDPSMFDSGCYLDYAYNTLERPSHINSELKNVLTWTPRGAETGMYYTGNVYATMTMDGKINGDSRYLPERNAVASNETSSWQIYAMFPTMIRNAVDVDVKITDAETGRLYYHDDYEHMDDFVLGSFYYPQAGGWADTTTDYGMAFGWDMTDPETGEPVPEGTVIDFTFLAAPDYYQNEDGSVRWDELGSGAKMSYQFLVDNTAPTLTGERPLTLSADGNTLYYTAQDNNFIAAVALLDGAKQTGVSYSYPDMTADQRGQAISGGLDLTAFRATNGNKAIVAVCDYAGNETYYAVNLGGEGADYGRFLAFQYDFDHEVTNWISFSEGVEQNETKLFASQQDVVAAEYVAGYVFAQLENGDLYACRYQDMLADTMDLESIYLTTLENVYQDFAFNYADGKLYGLHMYDDADGYPTSEIFSIALEADEENYVSLYQEDWVTDRGGVSALGLAIDDTGTLYILATPFTEEDTAPTAQLWKSAVVEDDWGVSYEPFAKVGDTGLTMDYLQAMTWDHNTESLYWARFAPVSVFETESTLEQVNVADASCQRVGKLTTETVALMAPLSAKTQQTHTNIPNFDSSIVGTPMLREKVLTMNIGSTHVVSYDLDPWYTDYKQLVWSSDNEDVATVDENGVITAHAVGSANITAANASDETKSGSLTVQVAALDLKIEGIVSNQAPGLGNVYGASTYDYTMDKGIGTLTKHNEVTAPEELNFGMDLVTSCTGRGSVWTSEFNNVGMIYEMDGETGEIKDALQPIDGDVMLGMAYSDVTDRFTGIMNYYLYVDLPMTHEAEEEMKNSYDEDLKEFTYHKFDLHEYLAASDNNFSTGETGNGSIVDVVFCGITAQPGGTYIENTYKDFLGNWDYNNMVNYTPDLTLALMDNVGRIWYVDEITDMSYVEDEYGAAYMRGDMDMVSPDRNGVFAQEYVQADGSSLYNVFVIRQIVETPLHEMYKQGLMPRITYHFSSLYYAGTTEEGDPMYMMSLYDFWNNGTTNELYLYIPGHDTEEMDMETWEPIRTPDRLFDLGDTGEGNIIATIHHAEVLGGLVNDTPAPQVQTSFIGVGTFQR